MAATFDTFRFPAQSSEFIPYSGPKESNTSRHRTPKRTEPSTDDWREFEMLLANVPEDLKAPRVEGVATTPDLPLRGSALQHPASIEDALAYDKDNEKLKEGAVDVASSCLQAELELDSLLSVADGQTYNTDGGDMSPHLHLAQHRASPEEGFMNQGDGFGLETSPVGDFGIPSQPLETQRKRRRSSYSDADTSTLGQTPKRISEQYNAGTHSPSAKRRKSPPPLSNYCVSPSASTSKVASSPSRIATEPPVANPSGRSFGSNDDNDADISSAIANSNHGLGDSRSDAIEHNTSPHDALSNGRPETASQQTLFSRQSPSGEDGSERLHDTDGLEARGDGGNRLAGGCEVLAVGGTDGADGAADAGAVGAIAAIGQPISVDSPLPEKSAADGPLHRADFRRLPDDENERHVARRRRRHRQRKQPSSARGNAPAPAPAIKPPRSSCARLPSRLESALERGRTRVKLTSSRYPSESPSPSPRRRPAATGMKSLRGRSEDSDRPWREAAPQKLTQMSLRQLPSGESFLAAVIQDDRDVAAFAYDQSMMLIDRTLGDAWQVDSIAVTPVTLNSWLLTGYLRPHRDAVKTDFDRMAATQAFSSDLSSDSESDSGSDTPTLRSKALDAEVRFSMDDGRSSEDEDGSSDSNADFDLDDPCSGGENEGLSKRGRVRWSKSEDEQLRKCMREKWPWKEIFCEFPHRTPGAVRTRWHMLQAKV